MAVMSNKELEHELLMQAEQHFQHSVDNYESAGYLTKISIRHYGAALAMLDLCGKLTGDYHGEYEERWRNSVFGQHYRKAKIQEV